MFLRLLQFIGIMVTAFLLVSRPQNFASRDRCFSNGSRDSSKEMDKAKQELSVFTADYFSVDCPKLKPRLVQAKEDKTQCTNQKST